MMVRLMSAFERHSSARHVSLLQQLLLVALGGDRLLRDSQISFEALLTAYVNIYIN